MKENFTTEEWDNLLNLPYAVSMTVMVAAPSVMGAWGETKAMIQEPSRLAAKSGSALVGLLIAELQDKSKNLIKEQQNRWKHDQAGYRTKTLESPEEALAYKNWVLAIGLKVAEAAKEHGVAVSEPEKEALNEVSAALGIGV
ncbi:MAG: hypothetical protein GKC05_06145 [Methanomicrobiales archaeon]|nr:hypothetical protein [Methanomicrobiales archaeon]